MPPSCSASAVRLRHSSPPSYGSCCLPHQAAYLAFSCATSSMYSCMACIYVKTPHNRTVSTCLLCWWHGRTCGAATTCHA